jgi:hypothetical protein
MEWNMGSYEYSVPGEGGRRRGGIAGGNWVRFARGGSGFVCFGFRQIGFVSQFFPQGFEAVEFLDCPAVLALGLGLIAQQEGKTVVVADQAVEAIAQQVIEVLGLGDFDIRCELRVHGEAGFSIGAERLAEAVGEEAGFEAGGAEDGLLGESDALKGEEFLGIDGAVGFDEVFPEGGDLIEVFEADDGEAGGGEAVFAGILGRAGLALKGAGAGGIGGVGAIGGELVWGNGKRHGNSTLRFEDGMEGVLSLKLAAASDGKEREY